MLKNEIDITNIGFMRYNESNPNKFNILSHKEEHSKEGTKIFLNVRNVELKIVQLHKHSGHHLGTIPTRWCPPVISYFIKSMNTIVICV